MFDVVVEQDIAAGHQLRGYQGKCENFHGHNWKVRLEVESDKQDKCGLVIDFGILKKILKDVLEEYDHTMLNDLPQFQKINPTSENLAKVIYGQCKHALKDYSSVKMKAVYVWESSRSFVRYYE